MDIVTIDFETFYDKEYSLSKITTEEYVRSDQFECIGVSVKVNDNPGDWYSGNDVKGFLNSLDYSDKAILCHHAAFDGAILSWRYGIKPKLWLDTLSMARPTLGVTVGGSLKMLALHFRVGEKGTEVIDALGKHRADFTPGELHKYGNYCINDGEITYKIFKKLAVGFPACEIMVIDQIIRMYTEPQLELDRYALQEHLARVKTRKARLLATLGNGDPKLAKKVLMSNPKFAELLGKLGAVVPMKISPRTEKMTYAFAKTDPGFKALLDHPSPAVVAVTEARMGTKSTIEETRTQRLIDVSERGPLPIMLKYYAAHTGRFGGGDKLNLQNLPVRQGNTIRRAILPPEGRKVVVGDSSQIEARMLAFLAGQHDLTQAFREGRDVYSEFASTVYGRPIDRKRTELDSSGKEFYPDYAPGFVGKTCILGLGYGMGWERFIQTLLQGGIKLDEHEAKRIVYLYRDRYPAIPTLWRTCDHILGDMEAGRSGVLSDLLPYDAGGITLPNGMILKYNALRSTSEGHAYISEARAFRKFIARIVTGGSPDDIQWTKLYGAKVVENLIQALARIVVAEQMLAMKAAGLHVVLQVHDENVVCPPTAQVDAVKQVMERIMSTPPAWAPTLPVACEVGVGDSYGSAK